MAARLMDVDGPERGRGHGRGCRCWPSVRWMPSCDAILQREEREPDGWLLEVRGLYGEEPHDGESGSRHTFRSARCRPDSVRRSIGRGVSCRSIAPPRHRSPSRCSAAQRGRTCCSVRSAEAMARSARGMIACRTVRHSSGTRSSAETVGHPLDGSPRGPMRCVPGRCAPPHSPEVARCGRRRICCGRGGIVRRSRGRWLHAPAAGSPTVPGRRSERARGADGIEQHLSRVEVTHRVRGRGGVWC